jgi:RimJ/RimL family protein N-acetyltransferase
MINKNVSFSYSMKDYTIQTLESGNVKDLFLLFKEFNKKDRIFFGYPLFQDVNISFKAFKILYQEYLKEKDTWHYFLLFEKNNIIGFSYIKKIGFKNKKNITNKSPTLGGPFLLKKFRGKKLGFLMLNIVITQSKLLGVKKLYARHAINNLPALRNSEKCNFKATGKKYLNIDKVYDYEYMLKIS